MQAHDEWISVCNILPPTSPTGLDMRDEFNADVFAQDSYLDDQWHRVLNSVAPPCRFERGIRSSTPWPRREAAPPAADVLPRAAAPRTLGARRLTDDVAPFEAAALPRKPPSPRARSVAEFVRDMLCTQSSTSTDGMRPQYFSLGEVAQYFNNFVVDVQQHGPYTCAQISAMCSVPEQNVSKLWTFRPGPQSFTKKQVASRLGMSVPEVTRAYAALGFTTWVLHTHHSVKK